METDRAHTAGSFPVVRFNAVLKLLAANRRPCLTFSAALANSVVQRNRVLATGSLAQGEEDLSRHSFGFAGGLLREQAQVLQQNPEGVTAKAHQGVALAGAITKPLRKSISRKRKRKKYAFSAGFPTSTRVVFVSKNICIGDKI
jgi:hypothetical protein